MKLTYELTADLLDRGVWQSVSAMQYDANTRAVEVTLTAGGVAWTPPEGTAVSVAFKKPDGKKGWYDKLPDGSDACSVSGNVVTAILAPEVLTAAGEVRAAIVFQDANLNQLATFGFSVLVEANPAAGGSISNNYYRYSTMEQISGAVEEMLDSLEGTKADIGLLLAQAGEAVAKAQQESGPAIVCGESGTVIPLEDASDRKLRGLRLCGRTVQDGIPSLEAPLTLTSPSSSGSVSAVVAGKNLCDAKSVYVGDNSSGVSVSDDGYEIISVGGTIPYAHSVIYISPEGLRGKQLYLKADSVEDELGYIVAVICECYLHDGTRVWPGAIDKNRLQTALVIPEDAASILIELCTNNSEEAQPEDNTLTVKGLMLSLGGYAPWEQYRPIQTITASTPNGLPGIPVASGGNYTDESGQQWLCDEIDFTRGVRIKRTDGGWITSDFTFLRTEPMTDAKAQYRTQITIPVDWKNSINYTAGNVTGLFSHGNYLHAWTGTRTYGYVQANALILSLPASCGTTVEEVKAYIAQQEENGTPLEILYPLASPIETPLSADELAAFAALYTYKPGTTVYNDEDVYMELEYVADTKRYIDNKFNELAAAIVSNA